MAASAVSLIGFGIDSEIEVAAATVVLNRLTAEILVGEPDEAKECRALKFTALTFFALATYVILEGARDLFVGEVSYTSIVGIVITGASGVSMPWLPYVERKAGRQMSSRLVFADAAETRLSHGCSSRPSSACSPSPWSAGPGSTRSPDSSPPASRAHPPRARAPAPSGQAATPPGRQPSSGDSHRQVRQITNLSYVRTVTAAAA
ncbi:hypothetical protein AB0J14_25250 [Micromonospora arborensis]|uniref:hypothetical protein n=1 Tax=Micromonospora arborensis TaxID=2116518 RepID=UPI0033E1679B